MKKRLSECNSKAEGLDAGLDPAIGLAESLPEAWTVVPFVRSIDDKRVQIIKVQQAKYKNAGQFPIIDQGQKLIAGYWDDERDVYRGRLPVIVFGDHTRAFKFVDFPFVAGADGTHVLAPCADRFDPYFLYLAFSSLDIPSRGYNRHFRFLKERSVVAPPLPEQRAIAAALRTVQRAKEACEKVIAATRALKQSLLHHLFTYGPVRFDQADRVVLKETKVGMVPEHWQSSGLGDLAAIERGKFAHRPRNDPRFYGGSIPFIQTGDVTKCSGRITSFTQTLNDLGLSVSRIFRKGTIVLTIAANIGDTGILEFDSAFPDSLVGITPKGPDVDPEFLLRHLQTRKAEMDRLAPRGTQKNVNIRFLEPWPVVLPPVSEQHQIVAQVAGVDAKLAAEEKRRTALDNLFQSLLHNLMTGRVRVNHLFDELVGADPRVGPVEGAHGGAPLRGGPVERVPDEIRSGQTSSPFPAAAALRLRTTRCVFRHDRGAGPCLSLRGHG